MRTLSPTRDFLRVRDKFFCSFVLHDKEIKQGQMLVYLCLYFLCGDKDHCWPSQATLASMAKCTERSLQRHLAYLEASGFIRIEKQNGRNVYRLLLSSRVQSLLDVAGVDLSGIEDTTKTTAQGDKISPNIRNIRIQRSPLSPLPTTPPEDMARRKTGFSSCTNAKRRGDFSSGNKALAAFEALYAAWPMKKDKLIASRVFCSLYRTGNIPPINDLLAIVERFKAEDRHWKNGCPPTLTNWLRGRRWQDEPFQACLTRPDVETYSVPPADPELQSKVRAVQALHQQKLFSDPRPSPLTGNMLQASEELCALWPDANPSDIQPYLFLRGLRGENLASIVSQARVYLQQTPMPMPALEWLKREAL